MNAALGPAGAGLRLRPRADAGPASRFARSLAESSAGVQMSTAEFPGWLAERRRAHRFGVELIDFADLDQWSFERVTGNLVHHTGRFFSIEGLRCRTDEGPFRRWEQPIITQPEVGMLGLLVKEFDGVLHALMQAKMEPGNPNLLQLSPTVQATRSNFTGVHRGAKVRYLDYFVGPRRGRVLADVLQSEHGAWFHHKANRNMIVEATGPVPVGADFCWLTLGQLGELLRLDNVVNMDARTVLACAPVGSDESGALHSDTELLSWFTAERARRDVRADLKPLTEVTGWRRGRRSIDHEEGRYFRVVAASVTADNREVSHWTQPLIEQCGIGVAAFLTRHIDGVPHLLAQARAESGTRNCVELAPTVQCVPDNYRHLDRRDHPRFLHLVLGADPGRVRYSVIHSEEGGRFRNAESRYMIIEVDATQVPLDPPPGFCWISIDQLRHLVRHPHYLNVQARTLLACLNTGAVSAEPC
ncbi:NDP-hexose 2,3-dehydratase family protein [Micromonospora endophytica]|uniref:NDP-hexose 2,3-dehydratase n=1 Tax=Micromonospora endophytica TaxID=515350 RepID=A0A2W2CRJ5_9ACTN|nr:NDP-hexose 2,3-dehydratase family protein [Micromonospora endophytica]PZG01213.1 NDP-hexose 2,3-dehydratase [Micromonospora endophytica]RIW45846.1 NDP-hexose 2,3-dehydratase [Micromonospora endophytica]BCJ61886.1 NDP-hexose 2,3-dehydratase [Micromonospora endophytica]